jgi:hypothetical protein
MAHLSKLIKGLAFIPIPQPSIFASPFVCSKPPPLGLVQFQNATKYFEADSLGIIRGSLDMFGRRLCGMQIHFVTPRSIFPEGKGVHQSIKLITDGLRSSDRLDKLDATEDRSVLQPV